MLAGEYAKAQDLYLSARELSVKAGNVGKKYIESQLEKARAYMEVYDWLSIGEIKEGYGDLEGAIEAYKQAREKEGHLHAGWKKKNRSLPGRSCHSQRHWDYRYEPGHWYRTLIIDCGGNNLTYRILQLIKVKLYLELSGAGTGINSESIGDWEKEYAGAEHLIPTLFKDYEDKERATYFFVKNNYYYLFDLAEQVKKLFFQNETRYELWIGTDRENDLLLDKWKLSVVQNGQMKRLDKPVRFRLYLYQIEELLRPDIYQLMERFLKSKFIDNELQQYDMIKLTGQSCRSRLFEEALKEYVPGVLIQRSDKKTDGSELKMCCLEGALAYFFNQKLGYMNVSTRYDVGVLPYEIMVYTHENKPQVLVHGRDKDGHIGYISRFMLGKQLDIQLMDRTGALLKTCYYECGFHEFEQTTQEEIDGQYAGTVIQDETDTILEGEMKFFIWADRQRWGFTVLPVRRENDLLYRGEETFFDFEDDTWENNFFDGRK